MLDFLHLATLNDVFCAVTSFPFAWCSCCRGCGPARVTAVGSERSKSISTFCDSWARKCGSNRIFWWDFPPADRCVCAATRSQYARSRSAWRFGRPGVAPRSHRGFQLWEPLWAASAGERTPLFERLAWLGCCSRVPTGACSDGAASPLLHACTVVPGDFWLPLSLAQGRLPSYHDDS